MPTSKKETVALKLLVLYLLIFVTSAYIPNLGPLGPSLPFEKFLVVVGGGWVVVVVETNFSVQLSPKLNKIEM